MDCFNYNCPLRQNTTSNCNHCDYWICQNRCEEPVIYITSNHTLTADEIITALRCCAKPGRDCEEDCPMNEISREPCRKVLAPAAADLIENQRREIEALQFNLAALSTSEKNK
jgi:hypothetical protein|nr:MAG TPA: hypothetical protein [Caudoviricetes sp.]